MATPTCSYCVGEKNPKRIAMTLNPPMTIFKRFHGKTCKLAFKRLTTEEQLRREALAESLRK